MSAWEWIRARQGARCHTKRLEVATSVSLGEKRFVAVIQIDGKQFLVGGGATNVALLAQLNSNETFSNLLNDKMAKPLVEPKKRPVKKSAEMELGRAGAQA
jgi:flagellar biogenesis protein FliO